MKRILCVLVLALAAIAATAAEEDHTDLAFKLYSECSSNSAGLSPCLKKKAIAFMDRLSRMDHLSFFDTIQVNRDAKSALEPAISEEQLDASLPRSVDAQEEILSSMLWDKVGKFMETRSVEVDLPKISEFVEEGRKGGEGGGLGGGGGGGKDKKGGMMKGLMMGIVAKLAALIPIAIAGLFLLAKKALITAKIALLISGIIFIQKLFAAKHAHQSHGHGGGGGWQSGGGSGGWQSSGGGWDKRSIDEAQKLAYKAYKPQQ